MSLPTYVTFTKLTVISVMVNCLLVQPVKRLVASMNAQQPTTSSLEAKNVGQFEPSSSVQLVWALTYIIQLCRCLGASHREAGEAPSICQVAQGLCCLT